MAASGVSAMSGKLAADVATTARACCAAGPVVFRCALLATVSPVKGSSFSTLTPLNDTVPAHLPCSLVFKPQSVATATCGAFCSLIRDAF